jgi:hypothetical protein
MAPVYIGAATCACNPARGLRRLGEARLARVFPCDSGGATPAQREKGAVVMPAGASAKREREYKELEHRFRREGRYRGREGEVAARIVNKQRKQYGETSGEKQKEREGRSPDRNLPIRDYQHLTVSQIGSRLAKLSARELRQIEQYEKKHKHRTTLLRKLERARADR